MKHAKQILSSMLILLMLCGTACEQQAPPDTTDTTAPPAVNDVTTAAPETDDGKDENGFLRDTLPEDLRYNDETIRILTWSDVEHNEFEVEQTTGDLILSPDFLGEKTIGIVEMLNNQLWNSTDCAYMAGTDATTLEPFANNAVMFCFDRVRQSLTYFANTTVDYGVVPCPVISADQDFVTVIGTPFTLYALPIDCRDPEMLSAVMECYASESYRQVTPALFEITFKIKYSDSEINGQMFDIIRESVTFDLGRLYFKVCGALGYYQVAIQNNENKWGSTAAYLQKIAPPQLESIQKAYE